VAGDLDLFKRFDRYDKKMFNKYLNKAKKCIKKWNFSCAEDALAKAKKYISSKRDKEKIKRMYSYLEEEKERKRRKEEKRYANNSGTDSSERTNTISYTISKYSYDDHIEYVINFSDGRKGLMFTHFYRDNGRLYYHISINGDGLKDFSCDYYPDTKSLICPRCNNVSIGNFYTYDEALDKIIQCAIE